jgi:hypothetical protein
MTFNMMGFVLSDIIARNRGVRRATALRDGLLGGILGARSPMLAVVLTSVISQNQESSRSVGARPTLAGVTSATPGQLSFTGSNFGTDPKVITVTFSWQVGSLQATETAPLSSYLVTGTLSPSPSSFTMNVPPGLPSSTNTNVSMVVTVNGVPSNTFSFQTGTPASITATSGASQSAGTGMAFALLGATVKDILGNPVVGAAVTFTAPTGTGASGTFDNNTNTAMTTTNGSGIATAPQFTANRTPGTYTVTATVATATVTANYSLTNT